MELTKKKCECCGNDFFGKDTETVCYLCKYIIRLVGAFDLKTDFGNEWGTVVKRVWEAVQNPKFDEAGRVHDWRNYIPEEIQKGWFDYTDETRAMALMFATNMADKEEWD